MSDLISRSELIKHFEAVQSQEDAIGLDFVAIIDEINKQTTAYSVDKVVEELKELKMRYFLTIANTGDEKSDFAYENVGNALDKAIEIVKQGCVYDDVCEWNQRKGGVGLVSYNISCCDKTLEMPISTARGLKYCPYCGKKIKEVK